MAEEKNITPATEPEVKLNTTPEYDDNSKELETIYDAQDDLFARMRAYDEGLTKDDVITRKSPVKIFLAIAAACLIGLVALFVAPLFKEEEIGPKEAITVVLSNRSKSDVSEVKVNLKDGTSYTMAANTAGKVYCLEDPEYPVDQTNAGSLFYVCASLSSDDLASTDMTRLADFGLDDPNSTVNVLYNDGKTATYYVGDRTPGGNTWYFMMEGRDEIYVVFSNVGAYMTSPLVSYHDAIELDEIDYASFKYLEIENKYGTTRVEAYDLDTPKLGVMTYRMTEPYTIDVSSVNMSNLATELSGLDVNTYIGTFDDLAPYGLAEPQGPASSATTSSTACMWSCTSATSITTRTTTASPPIIPTMCTPFRPTSWWIFWASNPSRISTASSAWSA